PSARARSTVDSARAGAAEPTEIDSDTAEPAASGSSETGATSTGAPKKRRRRGHRGGRNRKRPGTTGGAEGERALSEATAEAVADVTGEDVLPKDAGPSTQRDDAQPDETPSAPRQRRRRRGSGS